MTGGSLSPVARLARRQRMFPHAAAAWIDLHAVAKRVAGDVFAHPAVLRKQRTGGAGSPEK
jgi:hypothetical protein